MPEELLAFVLPLVSYSYSSSNSYSGSAPPRGPWCSWRRSSASSAPAARDHLTTGRRRPGDGAAGAHVRWTARVHARGLPSTRRVWPAMARAATRRVTGCPAAARRLSVAAVPRTTAGTARTPTRVAGRRRRIRVSTAVPRTRCGMTWRRAARSAAEIVATVAAPTMASASASVWAWDATAAISSAIAAVCVDGGGASSSYSSSNSPSNSISPSYSYSSSRSRLDAARPSMPPSGPPTAVPTMGAATLATRRRTGAARRARAPMRRKNSSPSNSPSYSSSYSHSSSPRPPTAPRARPRGPRICPASYSSSISNSNSSSPSNSSPVRLREGWSWRLPLSERDDGATLGTDGEGENSHVLG